MVEFVNYVPDAHESTLRDLWTAYLSEDTAGYQATLGIEEDVPAVVEDDLRRLAQFAPPAGRLLLAVEDGVFVGCGCLRRLAPGVGEIKRMYLDPAARGKGFGRQLLAALLHEARKENYREARLDTGPYTTDAHRLYRAAGFIPCDPYPESEIPAEFHDRWLFMRRDL